MSGQQNLNFENKGAQTFAWDRMTNFLGNNTGALQSFTAIRPHPHEAHGVLAARWQFHSPERDERANRRLYTVIGSRAFQLSEVRPETVLEEIIDSEEVLRQAAGPVAAMLHPRDIQRRALFGVSRPGIFFGDRTIQTDAIRTCVAEALPRELTRLAVELDVDHAREYRDQTSEHICKGVRRVVARLDHPSISNNSWLLPNPSEWFARLDETVDTLGELAPGAPEEWHQHYDDRGPDPDSAF